MRTDVARDTMVGDVISHVMLPVTLATVIGHSDSVTVNLASLVLPVRDHARLTRGVQTAVKSKLICWYVKLLTGKTMQAHIHL